MKVWKGLDQLPPFPRGTAVAIGNFDGLHLGHQKILRDLIQRARARNAVPLVLTFSPHPEKVLGRGRIAMIQTLDQRLSGMKEYGVGAALVSSFNQTFAGLTAEEFARQILSTALQARDVVVGKNFRFGKDRRGDIQALRGFGQQFGFKVHPIPAVVKHGRVVSSSLIRKLLKEGKVDQAHVLLGRPYEIEGRVVKGAARGKKLGFPTANIRSVNEIVPLGVFITLTRIRQCDFPSVANIGRRPTFGRGPLQIESSLFDFDGNLYRQKIKLIFLQKLRGEKKFPSSQVLIGQIQKDVRSARAFFNRRPA